MSAENKFTKHNKMLSIKTSSNLMTLVSENFCYDKFCFCFFQQNKICPFLKQGTCIFVGHPFYMEVIQSVFQSRVINSYAVGRQVKCVNILTEERDPQLYVLYSKRYSEIFGIHIMIPTTWNNQCQINLNIWYTHYYYFFFLSLV